MLFQLEYLFMHNSIWNAEKCNKKPYVYDDYYNPLKMKRAHTETMHDRGCKSTLKTLRLHKIVTMWNLTCFTKEMLKRCSILLQPFKFHNCVIHINQYMYIIGHVRSLWSMFYCLLIFRNWDWYWNAIISDIKAD